MGIKFNGVTVKAMFVGDKPVVKVCVGGEQVWPTYGIFNGGTVTEVDGWRYHTFTESGLLEVVDAGLADVLVVDGGAGGGTGGGGGGMVWEKFGVNIGFDQPVTVGAGGAALDFSGAIPAQPGGASSLGDLIVGGQSGAGADVDIPDLGFHSNDGYDGTTGGGGFGGGPYGDVGAGGAGSAGGDGGAGQPDGSSSGGGGGAGGNGGDGGKGGDPYAGGDGGVGIQSAITGEWYGGGGGGGGSGAGGGHGGQGGGGNGVSAAGPAEAGAPGSGGGGGGGAASLTAGGGGSGVVVVRTRIPA